MKFVFIFLSFLITENRCCNSSKINQEALAFQYSAVSRGLFQNITIDKKQIKIISARGEKAVEKPCPDKIWQTLLNTLDSINIKSLENLKAPSERRFYDAAAHASLSIIYEGETYKTPSFDHGNPPEPIANLVKAIKSVSENIE